jgi:hypothetical protein
MKAIIFPKGGWMSNNSRGKKRRQKRIAKAEDARMARRRASTLSRDSLIQADRRMLKWSQFPLFMNIAKT